MSEPNESVQVKLISSLFSPDKELIDTTVSELSMVFGLTDWVSPRLLFDRTKYYAREMGWPLHRRFVSFEKLINPEELVDIKRRTNDIEKQYTNDEKRQINIDPGYISPERMILATGKNYVHRVYLSKGIYADLTLVFHRGSFKPLEWTYPDYADQKIIEYLNEIREKYMVQLRESKRLD